MSAGPTSTKPYLLRALYEWCVDNGYTPFMTVVVDARTRVPMEYVRDGEIVLNVGPLATSRMKMGNDWIEFSARFAGTAREVSVPVDAVAAIYARENGQGMSFEVGVPQAQAGSPEAASPAQPEPPKPPRPTLKRVK